MDIIVRQLKGLKQEAKVSKQILMKQSTVNNSQHDIDNFHTKYGIYFPILTEGDFDKFNNKLRTDLEYRQCFVSG